SSMVGMLGFVMGWAYVVGDAAARRLHPRRRHDGQVHDLDHRAAGLRPHGHPRMVDREPEGAGPGLPAHVIPPTQEDAEWSGERLLTDHGGIGREGRVALE